KAIETAVTPQERARFEADLRLRERLTLRDIAIFSHYVGDASQPLHVSMHETGWGDHPNPRGYTQEDICPYFAGTFVRDNLWRAAVAAQVAPYTPCNCSIWQQTRSEPAPSRAGLRPGEGGRLGARGPARHHLHCRAPGCRRHCV